MHTGVCVYGWMDATWRAMPTYVETDDHVRVSTSVRIWRARLSGADKGARRPTGHPRGARARPIPTPVSVCLYKCLSMARAPACRSAPQGPPPTGHRPTLHQPSAPDPAPARRLPPRQLGQPTGRRPPHRAPTCAPPPPSLPRPLARARTLPVLAGAGPPVPMTVRARAALCSLRARAPRPNSPRPRPPRPPRARLRRPFPYTYPPTSTGPPSCGQTFPGPKVVPGEAHFRWQTARLPRGHVPRPTGHRPSSPGGGARGPLLPVRARARPSRTANWRGPMEGGDPREPVVAGPPRLRRRVSGPLQAPGAAGPVGGRCLPTNLAKDRADAQRLVATRLLDRLHDPLGHFSRLQRIHPARGDIAIRQPAPGVSPREPSPAC
ncbi:hypothetical protein P174DRAFT_479210 [Aspergillus novofumigatus IBT 16806]|uniref:Uncharacterized protein n=1 Tax=Aspergillus novofumigatus (strain IBT 16806) TaxID=1392255 RepID=A0A2I1BSB8_ASPN1|nr:hypothetical protein P174DRAFT_479210 [Aspergillus novofumigatus IBT 16806]